MKCYYIGIKSIIKWGGEDKKYEVDKRLIISLNSGFTK